MANGLQGLTKHLALCLSGGRSGKNRPRYSTTIHLYVCQQVNVEILVISYLRVTQGFVSFEGTLILVTINGVKWCETGRWRSVVIHLTYGRTSVG